MNPLQIFKDTIGKQIKINLFDKTSYVGNLLGFDMHVNIMLSDPVIYDLEGKSTKINNCIINGQSVTYIEII